MEQPNAVMVSDVICALQKVIEDLVIANDFENSQFPDTWEAINRHAVVTLSGEQVGKWAFREVA
jgi:hypothetical protein